MANKKIIELDAASQINSDALFVMSQLVSGNQKTLKATVAQMQAAMLAPVSGLVTLGEASGSIASFSTDISDKLFSCYVNVTAQQAGSGTPAPDNVRAISGWSSANVTGCGKNLFNASDWLEFDTYYTENSSGTINVLKSDTRGWSSLTEHQIKAGTYTFTRSSGSGQYAYRLKSENYETDHAIGLSQSVTIAQDDYIKFKFGYSASSYPFELSFKIEVGSATTGFEAYNGTTHNIPFNTTVYGGVLDVLSGVLTNLCNDNSNLNSLTWYYNTTWNVFYANLPTDAKLQSGVDLTMFEIYAPSDASTWTGISDKTYTLSPNLISTDRCALVIKDSNYNADTVSTFASSLTGKNFVYPVKNPSSVSVTPVSPVTQVGQNNIFADTGNIDLKYLETIGNRLS